MLVVTRKAGETITIGGLITIKVIERKGSKVSIGVHAPRGIPIARTELLEAEGQAMLQRGDSGLRPPKEGHE